MRIFDTFPEGLALIRGGDIVYANDSLTAMLELHEYAPEDDPSRSTLRTLLRNTKITKLDREIMKNCSVWDFLESNSNGAAFELAYNEDDAIATRKSKQNFVPQVEGSGLVKYISLNKVSVSVLGGGKGKREKLFIVRDLTTMVNL